MEPIPSETGVRFSCALVDGKNVTPLSLPLSKEEIQNYYKLEGFQQYVYWEELYEANLLVEGELTYDLYYALLESEDGKRLLRALALPTETEPVTGVLSLRSLPEQADLALTIRNHKGENLYRIGERHGALYKVGDTFLLLPKQVYILQQALAEDYENGYQKIAVCQKLAQDAGLQLDSFLQNEQYHVVDMYDLDIKIHAPDHIELIPVGRTEGETISLQSPQPIISLKDRLHPDKRIRYARTRRVSHDLQKLATKRHIYGEEVALFFENPAAVLPEHDYLIDLEAFSKRVKGLIPIQAIRSRTNASGKMEWFESESGAVLPYDETFLKELMLKHPDKQYVLVDGTWIHLDPLLRKELLQLEDEEHQYKRRVVLDIKDNEAELEYQVESLTVLPFRLHPLPKGLNATLFDHQVEAYQWLCHLREQGKGGLLADDMGLGKTLEVIAFLLRQQELGKLRPTLIVCPNALWQNWVQEIRRFAPSLIHSFVVHLGPNRLRSAEAIRENDIILTSYDTLKLDQLILGKVPFQSVICDEAQYAKSHAGLRSRALRAMQAEFRLAMTGTPVENSLDELWTIMDFVQPGYLGSLKSFRQTYAESGDYEGLLRALKPYYLRRTKDEVLKDKLPKKHLCDPIYVEASKVQKELAASMLKSKETGKIAILNMLTKLRQIYGHPGSVIPEYEDLPVHEVPKLEKLLNILDAIRKKGEKALIYTEFRNIHSILKRWLMQRYGIPVPVIDGETPNRRAMVDRFNAQSGFGVMILSPRAGGVGLTITSANHVIHYTRWWNPAVENQATDRVYRIGQKKEVYVYHIITRDQEHFPAGSVEELLHELLEKKRELATNVIIPFRQSEIEDELVKFFSRSFRSA